jgi:hypothetical protein
LVAFDHMTKRLPFQQPSSRDDAPPPHLRVGLVASRCATLICSTRKSPLGGAPKGQQHQVGTTEAQVITMADTNANRWDWKAIIAAILLACYLGFAIWALFSPSDDPQRGMAIGFIIPVVLILVMLGLVLWRAVVRGRRWLVWTIMVVAVIPALLQMAETIYVTFFRTPG